MLRLCFTALVVFPISALGGTPGLITVVGEDPVALQISPAAFSPYKLNYNASRLSVWDTLTRDNLIPSGVQFTAPQAAGDIEPDCDVDLTDFAAFQSCFTGIGGGPPQPGCAPFDFQPNSDVDLTDYALFEPNVLGPTDCPPVSVTVFVEGLTASTLLGDAPIELLIDPDGDTVFEQASLDAVTVVSLDITPSSGPVGTPLAITMQPAIAPLTFDTTATAVWTGAFLPEMLPPSGAFAFTFAAPQVRESSAAMAVLLVGDGTLSGTLPSSQILGTTSGALSGELVI